MKTLLLAAAVFLTSSLCHAEIVWQNGRYVQYVPGHQYPANVYSRDYSQSHNRTDYALGINRYAVPYYGQVNRYSPGYQWGYSLGRRLRGCR